MQSPFLHNYQADNASNTRQHTIVMPRRFERDIGFNTIFKAVHNSKKHRTVVEARRVSEILKSSSKKPEILILLSSNENGPAVVMDVLSLCRNAEDAKDVIIPVFEFLLHEDLRRPMLEGSRTHVMLSIIRYPFFLQFLEGLFQQLSAGSKHVVCNFILQVALRSLEARRNATIRKIAEMCCTSECLSSKKLASVLFLKQDDEFTQNVKTRDTGPALWTTDRELPGGRHSNDMLNFRDISVTPTSDELTCSDLPYIPRKDGRNRFIPKEDELHHRLDMLFRLTREDILSEARDEVSSEIRLRGLRFVGHSPEMKGNRLPFLLFRFDPPGKDFVKGTDKEKEQRWKLFRGLNLHTLVTVFRHGIPVGCGVISDSDVKRCLMKENGPFLGICFDGNAPGAIEEVLKSSTLDSFELASVSRGFFAYAPILRQLQRLDSIPFESELLKEEPVSEMPLYFRTPRIKLPQACGGLSVDISVEYNEESREELFGETSLDRAQADALLHCLRSRVALCQGPPGTGKTFLGVLLVQTILANSEAKVLCVCYTNHALDSFLCDILKTGITEDLVRIGGRSKEKNLEKHSLFELSRRTGNMSSSFGRLYASKAKDMMEQSERMRLATAEMVASDSLDSVLLYLEENLPNIHAQFSAVKSSDGFVEVGKGGRVLTTADLLRDWKEGEQRNQQPDTAQEVTPNLDNVDSGAAGNLWALDANGRKNLFEEWLEAAYASERRSIASNYVEMLRAKEEICSLRKERDMDVVKHARVVGATTTGASIHADVLREFGADTIIVEEAGEVLESHVIASLGKSTKHLILIGDHQQLRPKVNCYKLSEASGHGYGLDISLFERLVCGSSMPFKSLQVQHRMRPEISQLVRLTTYPSLVDGENVSKLASCKGLDQDVLFLTHQVFEDNHHVLRKRNFGSKQDSSKTNRFEAELAVECARHILFQGQYSARDVTILTPYQGQMKLLMSVAEARLEDIMVIVSEADMELLEEGQISQSGTSLITTAEEHEKAIRIATVDNFQGEESAVVLCSLVRSNDCGSIGFLSQRQRVNVLLSRARNVLILIGDKDTLLSAGAGAKVWRPILDLLESQGRILTGLPIRCQNHPAYARTISIPDEFMKVAPNGGCIQKCTFRMDCGHSCPLSCHSIDREHKHLKCPEPCRRFPVGCPSEHPCPKLCHEKCGPCQAPVPTVLAECMHEAVVECHIANSSDRLADYKCISSVKRTWNCGHQRTIPCFKARDDGLPCDSLCNAILKCGHRCRSQCADCTERGGHPKCSSSCAQTMYCGHSCPSECHFATDRICGPCSESCEVRCEHSQCAKKCGKVCASCLEDCGWECEHRGRCPMPCGAPCVRLPCDKRCALLLECGHQCPGICGEKCPEKTYCYACGEKGNEVVDLLIHETYENIELDDTRMVFLPCGHFFTAEVMDSLMELETVYAKEKNEWTKPLPCLKRKPKACPMCRCVVHGVRRYGREIRHCDLYVLELNFLEKARLKLSQFSKREATMNTLGDLRKMMDHLKRGPLRQMYEACGGSRNADNIPAPRPSSELILSATDIFLATCIALLGTDFKETTNSDGENGRGFIERKALFEECDEVVSQGISLAEETSSVRSGATLRLRFLQFFFTATIDKNEENTGVANALVDRLDADASWIIDHRSPVVSEEVKASARKLRAALRKKITEAEEEMVFAALQPDSYHGAATWYECPQGHRYAIGDCGAAMEVGTCNECGARIGGEHHMLLSTNRPHRRQL